MTAANEYPALDRERAETYLRLQAEAELRRALAMPEYKPPRERSASGFVFLSAQARHMRRRRAILDRLMKQHPGVPGQAARQGPQAPANPPDRGISSLLALRRVSASSAAKVQSVIGPQAHRLWQSAIDVPRRINYQVRTATWRLGARLPGPLARRRYEQPPAHACAERVLELAAVLAAVGAISAQTEAAVVADFTFALAARGRIEPEVMFGDLGFRRHRMARPGRAHSAAAAPPIAIPVGVAANGEVKGVPIHFYLGVLVLDQGDVTLTVEARFPSESFEHDHHHVDPMFDALSDISAVDDRGGIYHANFSGGGGDGKWDGRLHLTPAPPAAVRWIDMTLPGAPVVRILMDVPPRDLRLTTEAVTTTAADRFLDAQTAQLMVGSAADVAEILAGDDTNLFGMAADLLAAGVLTTSSGSLRRLAGVAAHFGVRLPRALDAIEAADPPADWLSLTARADRQVGPTGIIAVAAVLPEVDGVQCVIGELASDADSATIQVHARGWPEPRHHGGLRVETFEWTARDDLGGWYLLEYGGWSQSDGEADLDLEFTPALDPRARSLDIILTGPTTRAAVTVPLDWQEVA